ncbi:MAG: hypothetical protein ACR2NZ_12800 [Rubripirellula sp.]
MERAEKEVGHAGWVNVVSEMDDVAIELNGVALGTTWNFSTESIKTR